MQVWNLRKGSITQNVFEPKPGKSNVENICETSLTFLVQLVLTKLLQTQKYTFFQLNRQIGYRFPSQKKTRSYERKKS